MSRRLMAYLVIACAALAGLGPAWAAETVFPPGLRIGLTPTGDLKPSTRFPGFEDVDRKVAVTILDLPGGAYAELARAAQNKTQRGLTDVKREDFKFRGGDGMLITALTHLKDVTLHKWILLAAAGAETDLATLIEVEVPETALAAYPDAAIRQALASVTFRPAPIQEQLGLLPFTLGQLAGFRIVKVMATGGVILTEGPSDDIVKQPYVIVSIGRGSPETTDDRAKFARDLLAAAPLRDLSMQSAEEMRIGGRPGFEIRGQAKGFNNEPLMVAQWLRFNGGSFLRIVGVGRKDDWDGLFTRFRAVRDGINLK